MRIEHQTPHPELAFKVTAPLRVIRQDQTVLTAKGWTLADIELDADDLVGEPVELMVPFQGVDLRFPIVLQQTSQVGTYSLTGLTGRQREILALFYRGILSGRMASGEDMITSLDTPVDLVPMEQSEDEAKPNAPKVIRMTKVLMNLALYSVLALVMVLTAGSLVWDRMTSVSLQHARVVAPIVPHLVATPGYASKILVGPGDVVRQGQKLIAVSLPDADADVEDIRELRSNLVKDISDLRRQKSEILANREGDLKTLEMRYVAARDTRRIQDYFGGYDLRAVTVAYLRWVMFAQTINDAELQNIDAELAKLEDDLSRASRDLGIAKDAAGAADIYATVSGTVQDIMVFKNQYLNRSQTAVVLEEDANRMIQAWLPEDRLASIHLGMPVEVQVIGQGGHQKMIGEIASISGARDATVSDAFGLQIQVHVPFDDLNDSRAHLFADAPATVRALRPLGAAWAKGFFQ